VYVLLCTDTRDPIGKQYADFGMYGVPVRFVPEGKGPVSVAILLLQVRRGTVLLVDIGVSSAHWGGTILNGICATLRRTSFLAGILDYSDFQL